MVAPLATGDPARPALDRVLAGFGLSAESFTPAPSGVNRSWVADGVVRLTEVPDAPPLGGRVLVTGRSRHSTVSPKYLAAVTAAAATFGTGGYLTTHGDDYVPPDLARYWDGVGGFSAHPTYEAPLTISSGNREFMVRRFVPGTVARHLSESQAHAVGQLLGELDCNYWPDITAFSPSTILDRPVLSPEMPSRLRALIEAGEPARVAWRKATRMDPQVVIHGDLFTDNIVWTEEGKPVPIDWETAGFGPPVLDLAVAILGCCRRDGKTSKRLSSAMLDGYATPVPAKDLEAALGVAKAHLAAGRWWRQNDQWKEFA